MSGIMGSRWDIDKWGVRVRVRQKTSEKPEN
jgi:hypothetical protein